MPPILHINESKFPSGAFGIVSELTDKLTLNGGKIPDSEESFWALIGASKSVAVAPDTPVNMARVVLDYLGEKWDEDYEDEGILTQLAYEALIGKILDVERGDDDDDDEDYGSGGLAAESKNILVTPVDLAITTIIQWVNDGTLVLNPDWQRGYVWKTPRKRRFIESILMALPIPPVLLFKDNNGRLFVIDGRQRLETIYRFSLGTKDKNKSFTTFGKNTPGWGDGEPYADCASKKFDKLPQDVQRRFNTFSIPARQFMQLERRTLYEVFKRYNTGGDKLNPAEIRNAVYQGLPLHEMIYRLAGDHVDASDIDSEQRKVTSLLRTIMKGKVQRYGCYNFIGRVLAFSHCDGGSVANAINNLMRDYDTKDVEPLRMEFINAFNASMNWYAAPLAAEQPNGKTPFHEWVATVQLVSTARALDWIKSGRFTEDQVKAVIDKEWTPFIQGVPDPITGIYSGGLLQDKQNTTTHWARQKKWIEMLEQGCSGPAST